jgi:hypothetical protein
MRRRRRLWIILLAAPAVLLAADTLYWRIAVRDLEAGFADWEHERRAGGWTVSHQAPVLGGWPFAASLTIPAMSLEGAAPDIPGGTAWRAERLELRLALWQPGLLEIMPAGEQRLRVSGRPEVSYTADRLKVTVPLSAAPWPSYADVVADHLRAAIARADNASAESLQLHLGFRPQAQAGEPALAFALQAEAITLPQNVGRPLGPRVASLAVDGAVNGPVPVGPTLTERAASWRDGGGSLEIHHLAVVWGPLDLTASATLALDDQLQPMGAGSARLVGYAETLDALAAHAAISRSAATAAKAVLSLLASAPDDGSPPDVEVPLTLQYRTLSMRQVPLLRLPEIDWP